MVTENVEADAAIGVDVRVVDGRGEVDLGWLERIVGREVYVKEKDASCVWRAILCK